MPCSISWSRLVRTKCIKWEPLELHSLVQVTMQNVWLNKCLDSYLPDYLSQKCICIHFQISNNFYSKIFQHIENPKITHNSCNGWDWWVFVSQRERGRGSREFIAVYTRALREHLLCNPFWIGVAKPGPLKNVVVQLCFTTLFFVSGTLNRLMVFS